MIINKYKFYIYLIHGKYCSANIRFLEFYNNIHQGVKKMEWNWKSKMRQNTDKKAVKISFMCGCKCVGVYGCGCMCVYVDACFLVKSGQELKALVIAMWETIVYTFVSLTMGQIIIAASCGEWVRIWFVNVYGKSDL